MMSRFAVLSTLWLLLVTAPGCDTIDESSPSVSYASTTIDADFYQPGSSGTPSIDWNGSQGTIGLNSSLQGLSVNSTTGQLTWTKLLPPGTHDVEVVVRNDGGQVAVPVTIENPLSGRFEGTYSDGTYFVLDIREDETLSVYANNSSNPDRGEGTWQVIDGRFVFEYVYTDTQEEYFVVADVMQTSSAATLEGDWYFGTYDPSASPGGPVSVSIE